MVDYGVCYLGCGSVFSRCKWCTSVSLFSLCLSVLTEEFRGSVSEGLHETVYKRRRAGWRRETGRKRVAVCIFMDEVKTQLAFPASHRRLLLFFSPSDVQQMQSEAEMYQKVQHSEVPSDPRASYPFLDSWQFFHVPPANVQEKQRLRCIRSCSESRFPAHWEINVCAVGSNYR